MEQMTETKKPTSVEQKDNTEVQALSEVETESLDQIDDIEFLLDEVENKIAPLALALLI